MDNLEQPKAPEAKNQAPAEVPDDRKRKKVQDQAEKGLKLLKKNVEQTQPPENVNSKEKSEAQPQEKQDAKKSETAQKKELEEEVKDIVSGQDLKEQKGFGGLMAKVGKFFKSGAGLMFRGMVTAWLSIQKAMAYFKGGDPKEYEAIEDAFRGFFGVGDTQRAADDYFEAEGAPLAVMDGKLDKRTYNILRLKYKADLRKKIGDKATPEEAAATTAEYPFEAYLTKLFDDYLQKYPGPFKKDEKYVTTLAGIRNGLKPKIVAKPEGEPVVEGEGETPEAVPEKAA